MNVVVLILAVVVALLTLLVAGLLRSHAVILRRLHELGAGLEDDARAPAPLTLRPRGDLPSSTTLGVGHDVSGTGLREDALSLPVNGVTHRTLLAPLERLPHVQDLLGGVRGSRHARPPRRRPARRRHQGPQRGEHLGVAQARTS
jgi:hypothetical protein